MRARSKRSPTKISDSSRLRKRVAYFQPPQQKVRNAESKRFPSASVSKIKAIKKVNSLTQSNFEEIVDGKCSFTCTIKQEKNANENFRLHLLRVVGTSCPILAVDGHFCAFFRFFVCVCVCVCVWGGGGEGGLRIYAT